jgi:hypothetical protein
LKISTLTPSTGPRTIVIPDDYIGVPRYGSYSFVSAPQAHMVAPAASVAMANRHPMIPACQDLGLPNAPTPSGPRRYDEALGCYVRAPRRPTPVMKRPREWALPRESHGSDYWIMDRETGCRLRKICAQTVAEAQQIAAEFAVNNGGQASDCYAIGA